MVGETQHNSVCNQFGSGVRDRAGKLWIYVHPEHVNGVEVAITRTMFEDDGRKLSQGYYNTLPRQLTTITAGASSTQVTYGIKM